MHALRKTAATILEKVNQAKEMAAIDGVADIVGLKGYLEILQRRIAFLNIALMSTTKDDGGMAELQVEEASEYDDESKAAIQFEVACKDFRTTVTKKDVAKEEQDRAGKQLGTIYKDLTKPHRLTILLRGLSWDDSKGEFDLTKSPVQDLAESLVTNTRAACIAFKSEFLFAQCIEVCLEKRVPLPIQNLQAENIATIASLELDVRTSEKFVSEDEVLVAKKTNEASVKMLNELIGRVGAAAKDMETLIHRHTVGAATKAEKAKDLAEKKQAKDAEKEETRKRKAEEALAKKNAKGQGKVVVAARVVKALTMPTPPPVLKAVAKVQAMKKFATITEFEGQKDELAKQTKSVPYVILSVPVLDAVVKESAVKISVDIHKVQFPAQDLNHGLFADCCCRVVSCSWANFFRGVVCAIAHTQS